LFLSGSTIIAIVFLSSLPNLESPLPVVEDKNVILMLGKTQQDFIFPVSFQGSIPLLFPPGLRKIALF
jgi:hypothetical protein